jgi:hypothetical protein
MNVEELAQLMRQRALHALAHLLELRACSIQRGMQALDLGFDRAGGNALLADLVHLRFAHMRTP